MVNIISTNATSFTKVPSWQDGPLKPTPLPVNSNSVYQIASDVSSLIVDTLENAAVGESLTIICTVVGGYENE